MPAAVQAAGTWRAARRRPPRAGPGRPRPEGPGGADCSCCRISVQGVASITRRSCATTSRRPVAALAAQDVRLGAYRPNANHAKKSVSRPFPNLSEQPPNGRAVSTAGGHWFEPSTAHLMKAPLRRGLLWPRLGTEDVSTSVCQHTGQHNLHSPDPAWLIRAISSSRCIALSNSSHRRSE